MSRTAVRITQGLKKAERFPVSVKRKRGQPAHRPIGDTRLTKNEKAYRDACLISWLDIPYEALSDLFETPYSGTAARSITTALEINQEFLGDLSLYQLQESGALVFNEIKTEVAAAWRTLEKAEITPSQYAMRLRFDRASPGATQYARLSSANMVADMADSQVVAVRSIMTRAFTDGLTRPQTSSALVELLNDMPVPKGIKPGIGGMTTMFGNSTRGLTVRYADAVYRRAETLLRNSPGISAKNLKKKVDAYGTKLRKSRARTIARTEMMRASNQGRLEGMLQAADAGLVNPVAAKKQWVTSRFDVCPICVPLNGVAVGIKESFGSAGQRPPAHPNCRCTIRMLPDPLTYGLPTSQGSGLPTDPLRFRRPSRPGMPLQQLGPEASDIPRGQLIGQPGARGTLLGDDIDLPPVPDEPLGMGKGVEIPSEILTEIDHSATKFVVDGKFVPEREELHDAIVNEILKDVPVSEAPTFHFMGGGTASGKSSFLNADGIPGLKAGQYAHIDPDDIKRMLPETAKMIKLDDPSWVGYTHEESSYLSKRVMKAASERKVDYLLDGTGDSTPKSVAGKLKSARDAGYKVDAYYVNVPFDIAMERELARSITSGRKVPEGIIRSTHAGVSNTLPEVMTQFDSLKLFDNVNGQKLIMEVTNGKVRVVEPEMYETFLEKAKLKGMDEDGNLITFPWNR